MACDERAQCAADQQCLEGRCRPACAADDECGPGLVCDAGQCADGLPLGMPCEADADCAAGACPPSLGVCALPCPREATCHGAAVPAGLSCRILGEDVDEDGVPEQASTFCLAENVGAAELGAACAVAEDCRTGLCHLGLCSEVCDEDSVCGQGRRCPVVAVYPGGLARFPADCPQAFDAAARVGACLPEQALLVQPLGTLLDASSFVLDVPDGAASLTLVAEVSADDAVGFDELLGPGRAPLFTAPLLSDDAVWFVAADRISTMLVPSTPDRSWSRGAHCARVASPAQPAQVTALIKLGPDGDVTAGTLDLHIYIMDLSGMGCGVGDLNAATAPAHPVLQAALGLMGDIYGEMGVDLGAIAYHDRLGYPELDVVDSSDAAELAALFELGTDSAGYSVDVFLVRALGGSVGISGGIPGPPGRHGVAHAGVALNAEVDCLASSLGRIMAHEVGHALGLFHSNVGGVSTDPIADTGIETTNLMDQFGRGPEVTAGQGYVIRRHPNVRLPE